MSSIPWLTESPAFFSMWAYARRIGADDRESIAGLLSRENSFHVVAQKMSSLQGELAHSPRPDEPNPRNVAALRTLYRVLEPVRTDHYIFSGGVRALRDASSCGAHLQEAAAVADDALRSFFHSIHWEVQARRPKAGNVVDSYCAMATARAREMQALRELGLNVAADLLNNPAIDSSADLASLRISAVALTSRSARACTPQPGEVGAAVLTASPLNDLPPEVHRAILAFLPLPDLLTAACVQRRWRKEIESKRCGSDHPTASLLEQKAEQAGISVPPELGGRALLLGLHWVMRSRRCLESGINEARVVADPIIDGGALTISPNGRYALEWSDAELSIKIQCLDSVDCRSAKWSRFAGVGPPGPLSGFTAAHYSLHCGDDGRHFFIEMPPGRRGNLTTDLCIFNIETGESSVYQDSNLAPSFSGSSIWRIQRQNADGASTTQLFSHDLASQREKLLFSAEGHWTAFAVGKERVVAKRDGAVIWYDLTGNEIGNQSAIATDSMRMSSANHLAHWQKDQANVHLVRGPKDELSSVLKCSNVQDVCFSRNSKTVAVVTRCNLHLFAVEDGRELISLLHHRLGDLTESYARRGSFTPDDDGLTLSDGKEGLLWAVFTEPPGT